MVSSSSATTLLLLVAISVSPANANAFLHVQHKSKPHKMETTFVKDALLLQLATAANDTRIQFLEAELRGLTATLPKNEHGKFEASTVRYALHRFFLRRFGWSMIGLEHGGQGWNASLPTTVMQEEVPSYIQAVFDHRLNSHGLDLDDLAVFAATLLDLVHKEVEEDMLHVMDALEVSVDQRSASALSDEVVKGYLVISIDGVKGPVVTAEGLKESEGVLESNKVSWADTLMWAKDLRETFEFQNHRRNPFVEHVSGGREKDFFLDLVHRYSTFQNLECRHLKEKLVDMEFEDSGRVRLSSFYGGLQHEDWLFSERPEYLRSLGALDDSDPQRPSVIIANYLLGPSNCVTLSRFYSVCCSNECEGLMEHVESAIGGPEAEPARIAEVVSRLSSDTVSAPRNLSSLQLARLEEIARNHGGHVPLHGRLFSQWMHHAFPRECPFPHLSGTTSPLTPDEWLAVTGFDSEYVSHEEAASHVSSGHAQAAEAYGIESKVEAKKREELPWIAHEELVASVPRRAKQWQRLNPVRVFVMGVAVVSLLFPLQRGAKFFQSGGGHDTKSDKYTV